MKFITTFKSPNFSLRANNSEIKLIIIHYTAIKSSKAAINHLCNKKTKVSSHFFINKSGTIYYLVDLKYRAWHAGESCWKNIKDINSKSIGIEIDNSGHHLKFEEYTLKQISSLTKLLIYLKNRYKIKPENILGHSDISPYRKIDPGEKFPWKKLEKNKLSFVPKKLTN